MNENELADYINRKYAEAVLPLLEQRNTIDRELIKLDASDGLGARRFDVIVQYPLSEQNELVAKRAEINCKIRAYQLQDQEKQWIRDYVGALV